MLLLLGIGVNGVEPLIVPVIIVSISIIMSGESSTKDSIYSCWCNACQGNMQYHYRTIKRHFLLYNYGQKITLGEIVIQNNSTNQTGSELAIAPWSESGVNSHQHTQSPIPLNPQNQTFQLISSRPSSSSK